MNIRQKKEDGKYLSILKQLLLEILRVLAQYGRW